MAVYEDLDSLLEKLVDAAIQADMWRRDFRAQPDAYTFTNLVADKKVFRGNPGANDMGESDDTTDYEAEVFNLWPGVIEEIFAAWRADVIPDPEDFTAMVQALGEQAALVPFPPLMQPPAALRAAGPSIAGGEMGGLLLDVTRSTGEMRGRWVEAFHREYVVPLGHVLGNQGAVVGALGVAINAEAEMWREVRQAVADLAEAGAAWFDSLRHGGNVVELVVKVAETMTFAFGAVYEARKGDWAGVYQTMTDLAQAPGDIRSLIESNAPPDPRETGVPDTIEGVRTKISQTLEYTLNDHITFTEERLKTLLDNSARAIRTSRGTYAMGDEHLAAVADAGTILSPEQSLSERGIERSTSALFSLADEVTAVAGGIWTSVYAFVRPAGIGIGDRGPYDSVLALENAIFDAIHDTAFNLSRAASAVRIAADYAFSTDAERGDALARTNDKLDRSQQRYAESLRPPGRGLPPYTPPEEQLHVAVPDCLPDDPFAGAEQPVGPPFVTPQPAA